MTEESILQISNDIAEDMNFGNHSKAEYRQTIIYWMNQHSKRVNEFNALNDAKIIEWLKQNNPPQKQG